MTDENDYLFLDLETCGLEKDSPILEIAMILTDHEFNELGRFEQVVFGDLSELNEFTRKMHIDNGLIVDVVTNGIPWHNADRRAIEFLEQRSPRHKRRFASNGEKVGLQLAGNSVYNDLNWLNVHRSEIPRLLTTHRLFDVSCIRDFTMQFDPSVNTEEEGGHRAMSDLEVCVRQAKALHGHFSERLKQTYY